MKLMGISDEAGSGVDQQIHLTGELNWNVIELRPVEVAGLPGGSIHDIPDEAFDRLADNVDRLN